METQTKTLSQREKEKEENKRKEKSWEQEWGGVIPQTIVKMKGTCDRWWWTQGGRHLVQCRHVSTVDTLACQSWSWNYLKAHPLGVMKDKFGDREMAQGLRTQAAFKGRAWVLFSVLTWWLTTPVPRSLMPSSGLRGHCMHMICRHTSTQSTHIHKASQWIYCVYRYEVWQCRARTQYDLF